MLSKTALVAQGILIAALLYLLFMLSRHVTSLDERVVVYFPPQVVEVQVDVAALGREVFVINTIREPTWHGSGYWQYRVEYAIDGIVHIALHPTRERAEAFIAWLSATHRRIDE